MHRYTPLIIMGLFSWLFSSCDLPSNGDAPSVTDSQEDQEITAGIDEEGFVDLAFSVGTHQRARDGSHIFVATGSYNGREAGFRIELPAHWKKGTLGDTGLVTYQAVVQVESIGSPSDTFVAALRSLYGISGSGDRMAEKVQFTAMSLEGDPRSPEAGPVKIKLFFEPAEDDPAFDDIYAEHYLNIDLRGGLIEFNEKDPEYRPAVFRALTQAANKAQ